MGTLVYVVTTPSIAKEAVVARVENMIYQAGGIVKLITSSLRVSGHGNARDLQLMINLLRPKYLFPDPRGIPRIGCPCAGSDGSWYLA